MNTCVQDATVQYYWVREHKNKITFVQSWCQRFSTVLRAFSCTSVRDTKAWRVSQGLPVNRNAEGILTDGPDYTFLDGRPTPLLHKQKKRMLKQREFASQIVQLSGELDFAKERYQKKLQSDADEKQQIIDNRLKPKGRLLLEKNK